MNTTEGEYVITIISDRAQSVTVVEFKELEAAMEYKKSLADLLNVTIHGKNEFAIKRLQTYQSHREQVK